MADVQAWSRCAHEVGLIRWQLPVTKWDKQPLGSFLSDRSLEVSERYAEYRKTAAPKFFSIQVPRESFDRCWRSGIRLRIRQ